MPQLEKMLLHTAEVTQENKRPVLPCNTAPDLKIIHWVTFIYKYYKIHNHDSISEILWCKKMRERQFKKNNTLQEITWETTNLEYRDSILYLKGEETMQR